MNRPRPSIDDLYAMRAQLPAAGAGLPLDQAVLGILLDDLIERREAITDEQLLAECDVTVYRRGFAGMGRWVKVTHRSTGVAVEGVDEIGCLRLLRSSIANHRRWNQPRPPPPAGEEVEAP